MSSIILRSASPVFDSILKNGMREQKERRIVVHAKSVDDVRVLTFFMCTGRLMKKANARNLIHPAHFYQMDGLLAKCIDHCIQTISIDNFSETLRIFERYQIQNGYNFSVQFAKRNQEEQRL